MEKENISSRNVIHLFIQPAEGEPMSFRLDLYQLSKLVLVISVFIFFLICGTLLFFRELEANRKLQADIIDTQLKLQLKTVSSPQAVALDRQLGYSIDINNENDPRKNNSFSTTGDTPEEKSDKQSWIQLAEPTIPARIGSLSSECQSDNCSLKLELLPAGNGVSQGELLIVLETEMPRIGQGGVHASQRKQFIFYPGYQSRDEFSNSDIAGLDKRPFKFSKTLNASVNFKVTKLLRPLALNIYLFDVRKNLIHHERKVIDLDESYAN